MRKSAKLGPCSAFPSWFALLPRAKRGNLSPANYWSGLSCGDEISASVTVKFVLKQHLRKTAWCHSAENKLSQWNKPACIKHCECNGFRWEQMSESQTLFSAFVSSAEGGVGEVKRRFSNKINRWGRRRRTDKCAIRSKARQKLTHLNQVFRDRARPKASQSD